MSIIRADSIKNRVGDGAPDFPNGITITGVVTATTLNSVTNNVDVDDFISVGNNIHLGNAGIITAITFKGNGDLVELDVDGHTNLDNLNIAGVTTFSGGINGSTANLTGALTGTTANFSGNVSVGGTLTYEDVTNVDSVGLVTARDGVFIPDTKELKIGNTAGSPDLKIYHDSSDSWILSNTGSTIVAADTFLIKNKNNSASLARFNNGSDVKLYFNNNQKLATSNTGVTVTGTLAATAVTGDGSALTGIVAIPTGAIMAWPTESIPSGFLKCQGQAISRSTYSSLFTALGVTYGAGDGSSTFNLPDYRGEFLRGRAEGSTNDPDRASRTDRGDGNGGDNVGSKQDYAVVEHSHGNNSGGGQNHGYNNNSNNTGTFSKSGHGYSSNQAHSYGIVHSQSYGSNYANVNGHVTNNEVRPRNVYVHWIIKT